MKKLLLIFTLLFSVIFSFSSFAEWKEIASDEKGSTYVDVDDIKKFGNKLRYFRLDTYPYTDLEYKSAIDLVEGDCYNMTTKVLQRSYFSDTNAKNYRDQANDFTLRYHRKGTFGYDILDKICNRWVK